MFIRLLIRSRSFVNVKEVIDAFFLGVRGVIEYGLSILDCIGTLIGEQCSNSRYREGVPTVVVFKILLSYIKIFYTALILTTTTTRSYRTLCDVSALALGLNFEDLGS